MNELCLHTVVNLGFICVFGGLGASGFKNLCFATSVLANCQSGFGKCYLLTLYSKFVVFYMVFNNKGFSKIVFKIESQMRFSHRGV